MSQTAKCAVKGCPEPSAGKVAVRGVVEVIGEIEASFEMCAGHQEWVQVQRRWSAEGRAKG
jgi:hypothetical protein